MAKTEITLFNKGGMCYLPNKDSVKVAAGDSVSFSTNDGSTAYVYFSPEAISVLSPKPASPFPVSTKGSAEFSFSSSKSGKYAAYFTPDPNRPPIAIPADVSDVLRLEFEMPPEPPPFSGGRDTMTSGH